MTDFLAVCEELVAALDPKVVLTDGYGPITSLVLRTRTILARWGATMTDKQTTKDIVRNFILEKIYSTSRFDLAVLAEKYEIEDEFALAERFEHEATRINKLFGYPTHSND